MAKLLLVEDEYALAESVADAFRFHGYEVVHAPDGGEAIRLAGEAGVDAIILDIMLPDIDGFEVCRRIRAQGIATPILMLTSRAEETDRVVGLEIGADDYITKPFSMRELVARVRARLRRAAADETAPGEFRSGDLRVDFRSARVFRKGRDLGLTHTEFCLLEFLVRKNGSVVSRDEIMNHLRGCDYFPKSRTIDNHILNLRSKIEPDPHEPSLILTVHGRGYRFAG